MVINKIKVFEMFSGYGGASFALKKAGIEFETVGYSEIDQNAIRVYNLNHLGIKNYGDCTQIKPEEILDFDLLTGGFPCQPFSVNTKNNVRGDTHESVNLFKEIVRIVEYKRPRYLLLENVKGILGKKVEHIFKEIKDNLKSLGYDVIVQEANSKDYGLPQSRERVFFICKLGHWNKNEFIFPQKEELKLTILDILEKDIQRREPAIKDYTLHKECNIKKFGNITRLQAVLLSPVNKRNSNVMFDLLDAPSDQVSRQCDRIFKPTYSPCLTAT